MVPSSSTTKPSPPPIAPSAPSRSTPARCIQWIGTPVKRDSFNAIVRTTAALLSMFGAHISGAFLLCILCDLVSEALLLCILWELASEACRHVCVVLRRPHDQGVGHAGSEVEPDYTCS